jgi:tripartite-type tricarboxylate transporter receptor subunit TctC
MQSKPLARLSNLVLLGATLLAALPAGALDFPVKPITLIATFPPGGASDIVARTVAEPMVKILGQPVIVDNRPGAGGSIGAAAVSRAPADGYMLVLANSSPMSISPFAIEKSPYDPVKGFTHVFNIGATPLIIVANPKAGLNNMADLVKAIKAKPDYQFGSGGPASIGHIVGEMMKTELKANMTHIPYKGGSLMVPDLIAGIIPIGFDVSTAYVQLVKGGQLKALALTGAKRSELLPDVPTIVEAGFPNLVSENYFGISAPPGMPKDIVDKLHKAFTEAVALPATKKKLEETGVVIRPMSQPEFAAYVAKQAKDWEPAVRASGAKL